MEWIEKNKKYFIGICVVSVAIAFIQLFELRQVGIIENQSKIELGISYLPWVVFTTSFMPLTYLSWFKNSSPSFITSAKKVFFWVLTLALLIIIGSIYGNFVL